MHREVNTLGVKTRDANVAKDVLGLKAEVEDARTDPEYRVNADREGAAVDRAAKTGRIFVVSAPSGADAHDPEATLARDAGLTYSISATTRKRGGEQDGREYYFGSANI